jgi:SOS-response transcriptional repressor LexA
MMMELTTKQAMALDFIKTSLVDSHNTPTVREMARQFKVSTKAMQDRVKALEKKGHLTRDYLGGRYKLAGYKVKLKKIKVH